MTFAYYRNGNLITSYPILFRVGGFLLGCELQCHREYNFANIAISQEYSIDVTLESGGQYVEFIQ